jgi:hypothetical protein
MDFRTFVRALGGVPGRCRSRHGDVARRRLLRDGGFADSIDGSLPVDMLKIDTTFGRELGTNAGDLAIVRAIIGLVEAFGLHLVADGGRNHRCRTDFDACAGMLVTRRMFGGAVLILRSPRCQ